MTSAEIEAILCAGYAEQADLYRQAAARVECIRLYDDIPDAVVAEVVADSDRARQVGDRLAPAKAAWQTLGRTPSGVLAEAIGNATVAIRRLQSTLDRVVESCRSRQAALTPQLDGLIKSQSMRRAYGASRAVD